MFRFARLGICLAVLILACLLPLTRATAKEQPTPGRDPTCPATSWTNVPSTIMVDRAPGTRVLPAYQVWYCDRASAKPAPVPPEVTRTITALDGVYDRLVSIMQMKDGSPGHPLLDEPQSTVDDSAPDIYLLEKDHHVWRDGKKVSVPAGHALAAASAVGPFVPTPHAPPTADRSSGMILVPRALTTDPSYDGVLVHEFFHVLEYAHNAGQKDKQTASGWIYEASAVFAQWLVVPSQRQQLPYAEFFKKAWQESRARPLWYVKKDADEQPHMYAAWIWPLFVYQEKNQDESALGAIWRAMEGAATPQESIDAIDSVLPFAANFRSFARRNLDDLLTSPLATTYQDVDPNFPKLLPTEITQELSVSRGKTTTASNDPLDPLTAHYAHIKVKGDPRALRFDLSPSDPNVGFDVVFRKRGASDWDFRSTHGGQAIELCKVDEAYAITSNPLKNVPASIKAGTVAIDAGKWRVTGLQSSPACDSTLHGDVSFQYHGRANGDEYNDWSASLHVTGTGHVEEPPPGAPPGFPEHYAYDLTGTTFTFSSAGASFGTNGTGSDRTVCHMSQSASGSGTFGTPGTVSGYGGLIYDPATEPKARLSFSVHNDEGSRTSDCDGYPSGTVRIDLDGSSCSDGDLPPAHEPTVNDSAGSRTFDFSCTSGDNSPSQGLLTISGSVIEQPNDS